MIRKKALSRRTLLRGLGTAVALPFLDAMVPAARAAAPRPRRLAYVYMPMGCDQSRWTPPGTEGKLGTLSPILRSLAPLQKRVTVVTNLELRNAYPGSPTRSPPSRSAGRPSCPRWSCRWT
jgi:hypothetical protein